MLATLLRIVDSVSGHLDDHGLPGGFSVVEHEALYCVRWLGVRRDRPAAERSLLAVLADQGLKADTFPDFGVRVFRQAEVQTQEAAFPAAA